MEENPPPVKKRAGRPIKRFKGIAQRMFKEWVANTPGESIESKDSILKFRVVLANIKKSRILRKINNNDNQQDGQGDNGQQDDEEHSRNQPIDKYSSYLDALNITDSHSFLNSLHNDEIDNIISLIDSNQFPLPDQVVSQNENHRKINIVFSEKNFNEYYSARSPSAHSLQHALVCVGNKSSENQLLKWFTKYAPSLKSDNGVLIKIFPKQSYNPFIYFLENKATKSTFNFDINNYNNNLPFLSKVQKETGEHILTSLKSAIELPIKIQEKAVNHVPCFTYDLNIKVDCTLSPFATFIFFLDAFNKFLKFRIDNKMLALNSYRFSIGMGCKKRKFGAPSQIELQSNSISYFPQRDNSNDSFFNSSPIINTAFSSVYQIDYFPFNKIFKSIIAQYNNFFNLPNDQYNSRTNYHGEITFLSFKFYMFYSAYINSYFALPAYINSSHCCINPKNEDNKCFFYACVIGLIVDKYQKEHKKLPSHLERTSNIIAYYEQYFKEVKFDLPEITTYSSYFHDFEKENKEICLNVYSLDIKNRQLILSYDSKFKGKRNTIINLLHFSDNKNSHFACIKKLETLIHAISPEKSHHKDTLPEKSKGDNFCFYCGNYKQDIEFHNKFCPLIQLNKKKVVTYPPDFGDRSFVASNFKKHEIKFKYIIYADLETCFDSTVDDGKNKVMSYCFYFDKEDYFVKENLNIGYNLNEFVNNIVDIAKNFKDEAEEQEYIPLFFHNGMNFDAQFIFTELVSGNFAGINITGIMKTSEKFLSISIKGKDMKEIRILDSCQYLLMSLEGLVNCSLTDDTGKNKLIFPYFFSYFEDNAPLILKKNLFPYRFFTDENKLFDTTSLDIIFSNVNNFDIKWTENISLFNTLSKNTLDNIHLLGIKTIKEYHDIYLKCDVLQLSDIFNNARSKFLLTHKMELASFFGLPGASWASWQRLMSFQLPLLSNPRMFFLFYNLIRGGVATCIKRYAIASDTCSIIYLDANSLYPHAMHNEFPDGDFKFVKFPLEPSNQYVLDFISHITDIHCGAIFRVDLIYPDSVAKNTLDYPFCPFKCSIDPSFYSEMRMKLGEKISKNENKKKFIGLIQTIGDKNDYICNQAMLKFYLEHGMIIRKVHDVIQFHHSKYLQQYCDLNANLRKQSHDPYGKIFYKTLGNSLYGKTFENKFKQSKVKFANDKKQTEKILMSDYLHSIIFQNSNLLIGNMENENVLVDKPIYIGGIVTEYAKLHMYTFFYDKIIPLFGRENVQLVYTDTDSMILQIYHKSGLNKYDLYKQINDRYPCIIDCSSLNKDQLKFHNIRHDCDGELGKFKDECGEKFIDEFVGLRSKCYSIKLNDNSDFHKAKGVTKYAQSKLTHKQYKDIILNPEECSKVEVDQQIFLKKDHEVFIKMQKKLALSGTDSKRMICLDNINTLPYKF